ncbi:proteophosphoglycan 5 [Rhodotorula toruloides]|uniref:Proteophosphoglycan 5 n=1 Tax=Rhodotorula toruloides TaxID=5286 RepID=A0A511KPN7_RHOTO|nr:proteophosphoglycan 5 [Rhodotorula toruloides]
MDTQHNSHSRQGSLNQAQPIPLSSSPRSSLQATSTSPTSSALSQSLKAFQGLALSPPKSTATQQNPLHSDEFRQAYQHVRRASTGAQGRPIVNNDAAARAANLAPPVPGLSSSPSSSSEAGTSAGSLPTPSSSPSSAAAPALPTQNTGKARSVSNGKVGKPSATLGGVCEGPEIAFERGELAVDDDDDVAPSPPPALTPPASSSLFAGGARWGWPAARSGSSGPSPAAIGPRSPPASDSFLQRRGSLSFAAGASAGLSVSPSSSVATIKTTGFASPPNGMTSTSSGSPSTSTSPTSDPSKMMQPLGRVVSAGAALQTPSSSADGGGGGGPGFGLFRRFSISGLGARKPSQPAPPAPAPPSTSHPAPTLLTPSHSSLTSAPAPPALTTDTSTKARGRTLAPPGKGGGGAKGRKLSPMGERILRGGY